MATLTSLPREIINYILSDSDISFEDIINFRCVCKHFRWAAKTEEYYFLEKKFSQRWPHAKKYYDEQSEENEQKNLEKNDQQDKRQISFIESGIDCVKQLRNYNDKYQIMFKHRQKYHNWSNEKSVNPLGQDLFDITIKVKNYIKMLIFMDEIKHLLTQPPRAGYDLAERHCYVKMFDYLKFQWKKDTVKRFESYTEFLEQSATILAQQLQFGEDVFYSSVKASLDNITLEVLNLLREKHPNHSIFSTSAEYFTYWKENNIDDNYWSEAEGIQIMFTLRDYLFNNFLFGHFFPGGGEAYECFCIDFVLKNKWGYDIILYIIFQSVARQLGLRCDIVAIIRDVGASSRVCSIKLFWVPRYTSIRILDDNKYSVDRQYMENMKNFYDEFNNVPQTRNITINMGNWIMADDKDILFIYKQTLGEMLKITLHISWQYGPLPINIHHNIHNDLVDNSISTVHNVLRHYVPKTRPQGVKFSVGMIVTHGDQSTDCSTGVIIGWHQAISDNDKIINEISLSHQITINVCTNFPATKQQTQYIILTKNHKLCYVKEDDITLTKPAWIENIRIYYYFCTFENTHYVPNEMLASIYPDDAAITAKTIFKN